MTPYRYVMAYWPDETFAAARRCGTHTIIGHISTCLQRPDRLDHLSESGLRIVLQIEHLEETLLTVPMRAPHWPAIVEARDVLARAGLADRVDGLLIYDEPFLHLTTGRFSVGREDWPLLRGRDVHDPGVRDAFAQGLSTLATAVRTLWPVPVGSVEGAWCRHDQRDDPALDGWYQPAPAAYDFLAVDAYCPAPWRAEEARRILDRAYTVTAGCGRPILAVPQAFCDTSDLWRDMPTLWQLVAQLEWIGAYPSVVGVAYFCLDHPQFVHDARNQGLAQHPDLLRALERYADWCRDAWGGPTRFLAA